MIIIGLTGGIGTGKSTASAFLSNWGAVVLDVDSIGHQAYKKGTELYKHLITTFGTGIVGSGGNISRSKLAEIVFSDKNLLKTLNSMVHPHIRKYIENTIDKLDKQKTKMVVIDAAILLEAGWHDLVDEIWVVTAERKTVYQRLSNKFKNNIDSARKRVEAQMPQAQLVNEADVIIDNEGSSAALKKRINVLFNERIDLAREINN